MYTLRIISTLHIVIGWLTGVWNLRLFDLYVADTKLIYTKSQYQPVKLTVTKLFTLIGFYDLLRLQTEAPCIIKEPDFSKKVWSVSVFHALLYCTDIWVEWPIQLTTTTRLDGPSYSKIQYPHMDCTSFNLNTTHNTRLVLWVWSV